jgi:lipid-A-disaccharide synthase
MAGGSILPKRIFITVGETSGDNNAAKLVRALKLLDPTIEISGFGGPAMAREGAKILYETTAKAAMTFHALKRVFEFKRLLKQANEIYRDPARRPDLQICVDSSGVNLHFARAAKVAGIPVLYYVAPQLWASRPGRIKQVRRDVDRVASIFPFEAKWYQDRGVNATFVGHPLFDDLQVDPSLKPDPAKFPTIGIVPGSRVSEVKANLPHMVDVAEAIRKTFSDVRFRMPTTKATDLIARLIAGPGLGQPPYIAGAMNDHNTLVRQDGFEQLIPQCDLVITKSGTSTVHTAAFGVPMIVVYRVNPILWHLFGKWLIKTKKIAMVNILAGQIDLVPEIIPWHGSNQPVADLAIDLLKHPEKLKDQRIKLRELMTPLSIPGASMNVAKMALDMMRGSG